MSGPLVGPTSWTFYLPSGGTAGPGRGLGWIAFLPETGQLIFGAEGYIASPVASLSRAACLAPAIGKEGATESLDFQ